MTEPNVQGRQVSDFFSHFIDQSSTASELTAMDYPTLPTSKNIDYEEYYKPAAAVAAPPSAPTPQPVQSYAFVSGSGDPPPGYKAALACANCEYFCGGATNGYCYKYDFPCASNYLCDSYERAPLLMMESGAYSLEYEFSQAPETAITKLAEALQGGLSKALAEKGISLDQTRSRLFIIDQRSAEVALLFADHLSDQSERSLLFKATSKFAPQQTQQYLAAGYSSNQPAVDQPSDLALYKLASVTSEPDQVAQVYEELYAKKYGDTVACYQSQAEPQQVLSDMPGATVTAAEYVGEAEPLSAPESAESTAADPLDDRLRAIAEKRVSYLASKTNTAFSQDDVQKMLDEIKATRQKLDID